MRVHAQYGARIPCGREGNHLLTNMLLSSPRAQRFKQRKSTPEAVMEQVCMILEVREAQAAPKRGAWAVA